MGISQLCISVYASELSFHAYMFGVCVGGVAAAWVVEGGVFDVAAVE